MTLTAFCMRSCYAKAKLPRSGKKRKSKASEESTAKRKRPKEVDAAVKELQASEYGQIYITVVENTNAQ